MAYSDYFMNEVTIANLTIYLSMRYVHVVLQATSQEIGGCQSAQPAKDSRGSGAIMRELSKRNPGEDECWGSSNGPIRKPYRMIMRGKKVSLAHLTGRLAIRETRRSRGVTTAIQAVEEDKDI